jgi:flavorubredoxin
METVLRDNIDWVGHVDWTLRDFHSYQTDRGVTYNAYLIRDEKTALIDTVKAPFADDLLTRVAALTPLERVDYVICNHAEPDHAGGLSTVLKALPKATLVGAAKAMPTLARYHDTSRWKTRAVSTGDEIRLGRRTLRFIETPMVHWPESMFTYVPEDELLFSMDAFGQHYASSQRFDDQAPLCILMDEAKTYYANIIMPYARQVAATLETVAGLRINMIAPSHGVVWRCFVREIIGCYQNWVQCRPKPKVLVLYDSMWENTGRMAAAIHEGASKPGVAAHLIHIRRSNLTRIAAEVLDAAAVAVGSSTLNQGMMPMMGAVLTYLKGLRPANKAGLAFGAYGWSKGGPETVEAAIKAMKWELLRQMIAVPYSPDASTLAECREAGARLADHALRVAAGRKAGENLCVDP